MTAIEILCLAFFVPLVGGIGLMGGLHFGAQIFGPISVNYNTKITYLNEQIRRP